MIPNRTARWHRGFRAVSAPCRVFAPPFGVVFGVTQIERELLLVSAPAVEPEGDAAMRRGLDRRREPTPMFSRYALLGGRRRNGGRRPGEAEDVFVDQHGPALFLVVLGIVALNFLDAWFTMFFLSHGGEELNPVMDFVIRTGTVPFILAKSVGIGLCVAVLTVSKTFRFARIGLAVVLVGYAVLFGWHLWLYSHVG